MKLNEAKTKYLIFHRTQQQFATRLTVNGKVLERQKKFQVIGYMVGRECGLEEKH